MSYSGHIGLGLVPERRLVIEYVIRRRTDGADDATIIDELVGGKGPCASVTGAISCDRASITELVAAAPRGAARGRSLLLYGGIALAAVFLLSRRRR